MGVLITAAGQHAGYSRAKFNEREGDKFQMMDAADERSVLEVRLQALEHQLETHMGNERSQITDVLRRLEKMEAAQTNDTAPLSQEQPQQRAALSKSSRGVVVWLTTARPNDLADLHTSMELFHRNVNLKYSYPVIVFHEGDLTESHQRDLQSQIPSTRVKFEEIVLGATPGLDLETMVAPFENYKARYSGATATAQQKFGYSNMYVS
jgi:hypothetical protein